MEIGKKTTLSSRQACFVIAHSSGDFNDKNIHNHRLYTLRKMLLFYKLTGCKNTSFLKKYIFVKKLLFYKLTGCKNTAFLQDNGLVKKYRGGGVGPSIWKCG